MFAKKKANTPRLRIDQNVLKSYEYVKEWNESRPLSEYTDEELKILMKMSGLKIDVIFLIF